MQTISATALGILESDAPLQLSISCSGDSGTLTITEADIEQESFYIDRNSVSGRNIEIGNAETTEIGFDLNNNDYRYDNYRFEGATLVVNLVIGAETLKLGVFIVDQPPSRLDTIRIVALDKMARFNRKYTTILTGTPTLLQILQDSCTTCGVTLGVASFDNSSYAALLPSGDDITHHQVVAWVAELAGCNAWIDEDGELQLSWYGENQGAATFTINPSNRTSYDAAEADVTITGVVCRTTDIDYVTGTEDYALMIVDNPLVQASTATAMLSAISSKLVGYTYRPYQFDTLGYPHLWPMDEILFTPADRARASILPTFNLASADLAPVVNDPVNDGATLFAITETKTVASIITNHKYILNGESHLKAVGETAEERSYASAPPLTDHQKLIIEKIADTRADIKVTAYDQAALQFNELMANSMGLYKTVIPDPAGASIFYMHDAATLATSTVIFKLGAEGFAWCDTGWNGGSPVWNSGYSASGNVLAKVLNVIHVIADWITTGKILAADGSSWWDLDIPEFVQTAVINSKDVRVEMSPANPFMLEIEGATDMQKYVYVTDATGYSGPNILVTSKYDINEDGRVDWQDFKMLWDYILHRDLAGYGAWPDGYPSTHRLDVNNNGLVNSSDLVDFWDHSPLQDRLTGTNGSQQLIMGTNGELTYGDDFGTAIYAVPPIHVRTSISSAGSTDDWMKIATITLGSQYVNLSAQLSVLGNPSTAGVGYCGQIVISVLQQAAMGSAPVGRVYLSNPIGMAIANVIAVIVQNDAEDTVFELYVQTTASYKQITTRIVNLTGSGSIDITPGTAWVNAVPTGSQLTTYLVD